MCAFLSIDKCLLVTFIAEEVEKRRNRLKAKLRRACEVKKNGKMTVPVWLHEMWKSSNKDHMAERFEKCGFDTDAQLPY